MAGKRGGGHVSEVLAEVFRRGGMKRAVKRAEAVLLWPQVVGSEVARFTEAKALQDGATRFGWITDPLADRYDLLRGTVGDPGSAICSTGQDPDVTDAQFVELATPPVGAGWFYLVVGVDDACGGSGPLGHGREDVICP